VIPTHFVFGNCDWQPDQLSAGIGGIGATLHARFGHIEFQGVKIAWTHSHDRRLFHDLEHSDAYDYLFYGHSHVAEQHRTGRTLVVNPGAMHRVAERTCAVLDLQDGEVSTIRVQ
jgi:predicted phosphodiesterase